MGRAGAPFYSRAGHAAPQCGRRQGWVLAAGLRLVPAPPQTRPRCRPLSLPGRQQTRRRPLSRVARVAVRRLLARPAVARGGSRPLHFYGDARVVKRRGQRGNDADESFSDQPGVTGRRRAGPLFSSVRRGALGGGGGPSRRPYHRYRAVSAAPPQCRYATLRLLCRCIVQLMGWFRCRCARSD